MSTIDRKRVAAVAVLETLGYTFDGARWQPPAGTAPQGADSGLGMMRTAAADGRCELLAAEDEHRRLVEAAEAYERALAEGKVVGGTG